MMIIGPVVLFAILLLLQKNEVFLRDFMHAIQLLSMLTLRLVLAKPKTALGDHWLCKRYSN